MSIIRLNGQGVFPNVAERGTTAITTPSNTSKSAYSELIASTARAAVYAIVGGSARAIAATQTRFNLDIALGAGGSEVIKIPDLVLETIGVNASFARYQFPFDIPAGTRVAARASDDNAGSGISIDVFIWLFGRS